MSKRVLIIEDDKILNEIISELLVEHGFETISAYNGREGLRRLQEKKMDLVITDIVMPEIEGLETIQQIKAASANIPIIAMSGGLEESESYLEIAGILGAKFTFVKPFEHDEFLEAVKICTQ